MGTAEAVGILWGCKGWFFSQFLRGATKCNWRSGEVEEVLGDDSKVVFKLKARDHFDKRPPVEVPVHLINGALAHDNGHIVHLVVGEHDITLTRV